MDTAHEAASLVTMQMMPTADELAQARRRLHRKAAGIVVLGIASYTALVFAPIGFLGRVVCAFGLVIASAATGTGIMHDGNHGAFSTSRRVNRVAGWSSDLLGASSYLWRFKHNKLHHANTNVVGFDQDIDQVPFARLAPQQRWHSWHRSQHLYMWVLYGFLTVQWFLLSDFITLIRRREGAHRLPTPPRRRDTALILFGKAAHASWAIVLPLLFHPWWGVLAFYLASSWLVGFLLANFFQLAHCVDRAEFFSPDAPRRGADFELHQLRTTVDLRSKTSAGARMLHWLMGGLDYQIEHHLSPKLPHTVYPVVAPRLQQACEARGLDYRIHPGIGAAIRSHARWLRAMGRDPHPDALESP